MTNKPVDASLDFFSEEFDPIKALSNISLQPPVNIKPFDYLEKCRILLDPSDPNYLPINAKLIEKQKQQQVQKEATPAPNTAVNTDTNTTTTTGDNAASTTENNNENSSNNNNSGNNNTNAPAAASVSTTAPSETPTEPARRKTVLQTMIDELQQGPVALLHECCAQRARVRVIIRRVKDIRGHCTGQLIAYDKYFNLLLRNVTEEFTRYSKPRDTNEGETVKSEVTMQTRRVKTLLIKGDSVVLISRVSDK